MRLLLFVVLVAAALLIPWIPAFSADGPTPAEKLNPIGDLIAWITLLDAWGLLWIAVIVGGAGFIFWRLNSGATPFRIGDALIDPMTGKASILRIGFFAGLMGAWTTAGYYMLMGDDVKNFVLGLLAIFVTPVITNRAFEIFDPRIKAQAQSMTPPNAEAPPSAAAPNPEEKP